MYTKLDNGILNNVKTVKFTNFTDQICAMNIDIFIRIILAFIFFFEGEEWLLIQTLPTLCRNLLSRDTKSDAMIANDKECSSSNNTAPKPGSEVFFTCKT